MQELVKVGVIADQLGIHKSSVYSLMKNYGFPRPIKIGGSSRWDPREVDTWITRQRPYILSPRLDQLRGTVSSGTLRPQELIPALLAEVMRRGMSSIDLRLIADAEEAVETRYFEDAQTIVLDLVLLLGQELPPHIVFGSHPNDPQDFGYWPEYLYGDGMLHVS